jgi:hypothetical protein
LCNIDTFRECIECIMTPVIRARQPLMVPILRNAFTFFSIICSSKKIFLRYLGLKIALASLVPISGPKKSRYSVRNDGKMRIFRAPDGPRQHASWITDQSTRWSPNRWTQRLLNSWPLRRRRRCRAGPRLCPPSPLFSRLLWPPLRCGSVGYAVTGPSQSRSSRPTSPPPTSGTGSSDGSGRRTAACCAATWLPPPSASRTKWKVRNLRFQI